MSIEKITSKIISDAEGAAGVTLDAAKAQCDGILAEAEKKAAALCEDAERRGLLEKDKLVARKKAVADIDGRKLVLEAKQQLINQCLSEALDRVASMEKDRYISFLAGLVARTGETEGQLILNEKDRTAVGEDLIAYLAEHLPESKITLAEETRNIRGGFLLKKGSVYMNGTIESLLDEAKEDLIGQVAAELFQ